MHWLFLIGWTWSFLPDSKWLISPGGNKNTDEKQVKKIINELKKELDQEYFAIKVMKKKVTEEVTL